MVFLFFFFLFVLFYLFIYFVLFVFFCFFFLFFFEKVNLKKIRRRQKSMQNYPGCKEQRVNTKNSKCIDVLYFLTALGKSIIYLFIYLFILFSSVHFH